MSQDLLSISPEAFELQLYKIDSKQLVTLIEEVYKLKWSRGKYFTVDQMMDVERKQTKIEAELQRRGYWKAGHNQQYFDWVKKINKKKRLY